MKAKNILRISLFAALLCMITILGAFAAETDAKIFRFDGMGNMIHTDTVSKATGKVTSDGTFRIDLDNDNFTFTGTTIETGFKSESGSIDLSEYQFVKIKYKTNYPSDWPRNVQLYIGSVNYKNEDKNENQTFYIYSSLSTSKDWKTVQFSLKGEGGKTSNTYTGTNGGTISLTGGDSKYYYWPSTDKKIITSKPFFQIKGATDEYIAENITEDIYFELEYIAFFKTEEEMNEYNGSETKAHTKVIRWDGLGDIAGSGNVTDGVYKYTLPVTDTTLTTTALSCTINFNDTFTLYDYPYLKTKFKTNFTTNGSQWYINLGGGNYIYNDYNTVADGDWYTKQYYYPKASEVSGNSFTTAYGTKLDLSGTAAYFPSEDSKITVKAPFFHFRKFDATELEEAKSGNKSFIAEIEYVGFFDSEKAMLAYGTDEENAAIAGINTAVETILNDKTEYKFTVHPAITDKNQAVIEYVKGVLEDITVGYEATIDETNSTDELCKVLLTFESDTYTKTIGINVKITELADITPTVKGAQTRTDGAFGLRFGFTYNHKLDTTGYDKISYGALIAPKNLIGENAITLENVDKVLLDGKKIIADVPRVYNLKVNDAEEYTLYTAVVTDFDKDTTTYDAQCDVKFVAVPYVTYKVDGETFTVYGKQIERSVNDVKELSGWSTDDAE